MPPLSLITQLAGWSQLIRLASRGVDQQIMGRKSGRTPSRKWGDTPNILGHKAQDVQA
ncbi:hypothetical protein MSMEI_3928 [Mycolicibacterium smegmatis MC2 155]|jgi:hypothetical protein|uniref:Uncharacterized protein n=1 Tax=Mycolicibacterium smegmatis (strain ATCC 700084 / mc(2)155) TaxID=246196 RepID=I7GB67_MYCS2|nr:hypothetical protein MSMEI_3928 [Mycolicibacterium smegmatis MC2 155]